MASEKVYVGKAGAKELYTRVEEHIDARIPKVPGAGGNVGKFAADGSLEDTGVSADALESAVQDDHAHENKDVLDATTASYTTEEQEKLGSVTAGAEANVIEKVQVAGTDLPVNEKTVNIPDAGASAKGVVKLTSDLDSDDLNSAITPGAVREALRHAGGYKIAERAQDGTPDVPLDERSAKYIYLTEVPNTPEPDHYAEWIWSPGDQSVEAKWVQIGSTTVDMTNYAEKVSGAVAGHVASLTAGGNLADSGISGSSVSDAVSKAHSHANGSILDQVEEPYTTAEKDKLVGIATGAQENTIEAINLGNTELTPVSKTVTVPMFDGSNSGAVTAPTAGNANSASFLNGMGDWSMLQEVTNSEIDNIFGAFIGDRDYRTVIIGNQMWLAENLDWKFDGLQIGGEYTVNVANAWYYDNKKDTYGVNGNKYGLLYNGPALLALNGGLLTGGWRVPNIEDYRTLVANVSTAGTGVTGNNAGLKLKVSSAGGTDDYGFSMYMNGSYNNGYFRSVDTWGGFGVLSNSEFQYVSTSSSVDYLNTSALNFGGALCVRLVKDIT